MLTTPANNLKVDYLIVGQGICGTFLSWYLIKEGKSVIVVDEARPFTASKVASGVINPVTGRRIVRTWRIEELLPFALQAYKTFGDEIGADLVKETSILDFHPSLQMKEAFDKRLPEEHEYLHNRKHSDEWKQYFNYHFGVSEIAPCLLVDLNLMLSEWRKKLSTSNLLLTEAFDWKDCSVFRDSVKYKQIEAKKIICCEGVAGFNNPYFKNLPYSRMKGEVLIVSIPGLPKDKMYKQGLNIVPWKDDLFWVGSSYEWNYDNVLATEAFKSKAEAGLKNWLKIPFTTVDHFASERPANVERRPFIGFHPNHPAVGLMNGMGTKGCSLAPFFAKQLMDFLLEDKPLYADADVRRFAKVLARDNIN